MTHFKHMPEQDDEGRWVLPRAERHGHTLPRLIYDPDEETILSWGSRKLHVDVTHVSGDMYFIRLTDRKGENATFGLGDVDDFNGPDDSALTLRKNALQEARAERLVRWVTRRDA